MQIIRRYSFTLNAECQHLKVQKKAWVSLFHEVSFSFTVALFLFEVLELFQLDTFFCLEKLSVAQALFSNRIFFFFWN